MPELELCKVASNGMSSIGGFGRFFEQPALPGKKKSKKNQNH
jgi:hypothetical protein